MHTELPVGAFLAATVVLIPLPWHWRARNVPTLSIIAWLFLLNVIIGVNAIVWAGNVNITIPVWCDIVTKLEIGATVALPACCLCLCIHLERIASVRAVSSSPSQKRHRMMFDCLMCWALPAVYMALHCIVQGHRFDIVEDFGCRPTVYVSVPAMFLIWVIPLTLDVSTFVFAGLALVHFFRRRISFSQHLKNSNSALTTSRYFRLMLMAVVEMFWGVFVTACNMWFSVQGGMRPWVNWAYVHSNFSRIALYPTFVIPVYDLKWTYILWWTVPISGFIFSAFFSFGEDAMREYAACVDWVRRKLLRRSSHQNIPTTKQDSSCQCSSRHRTLPLSLSSASATFKSECDYDSKPLPDTPRRSGSFDETSTNESTVVYGDSDVESTPYIVTLSQLPPYSSQAGDMA